MSCTSLTSIIPSCITSGSVRTRSPSSERWTTFSCTIPMGSWCSENHGNSLVGSPGGTPWDSMGLGSYLGKDLQSMKRIVAGFKRAGVFKRWSTKSLITVCRKTAEKCCVIVVIFYPNISAIGMMIHFPSIEKCCVIHHPNISQLYWDDDDPSLRSWKHQPICTQRV